MSAYDVSERYFERDDEGSFAEIPFPEPKTKPSTSGLRLRALSEVQPRRVLWLVPVLIPLRTLTLVAGVGGLGKSTWLAAVAAQVSAGQLLAGEAADVILVSYEDPAAEVLRPRVEAAGGNLDRVHEIVVGPGGIDPLRLPADVLELQRLVCEVSARLVVIDPIVAGLDTAFDSHKDQHVRAVLAQLAAITEAESCAITMVGHLNKTPSRDAYVRVANSVAFWNAARSVVLVTEDEDDDHRLISQVKTNWARRRQTQRWAMRRILLPGEPDPDSGQPIETCRLDYVEDVDGFDIADVLGDRKRDGGATVRAEDFLTFALSDADWHDSADLKALAEAAGISERTLKRAAKELDVEHDRRGFPASTSWRLPQSGQLFAPNAGPTEKVAQLSDLQAGSDPSRATQQGEGATGPTGPADNDPQHGPTAEAS